MGEKGARATTAAAELCARIVKELQPIGDVSSRKMFGGHGIFESGTMFALVNAQAQLFLKADDSNRPRFEAVGAQQHGKMPYYAVPADVMADPLQLEAWAQDAIRVAHEGKKK